MNTRSHWLAAVRVVGLWRWCMGAMLSVILAACGGGADPQASSAAIGSSVARRVDASKNADVKETLVAQPVSMVNTTTAGDQTLQAIGALSDGGHAVAWLSGTTLYLQRYDSAGKKVGYETPIQWLATPADIMVSSSVAVLGDGSVVVAYAPIRNIQDPQGGSGVLSSLVCIQRFDASGVQILPETRVASIALGDLNHPKTFQALQILPMPDDGYLVGWTTVSLASGGVSSNWLSMQDFDRRNQRLGELVSISPDVSNAQFRIVADGLGGYTVYWSGYPSTALRVTHYDVHRTATQILTGWRGEALLVPMQDGRYVLYTLLHATDAGVYRQFLDSTGAPVGEATQAQVMPRAAQLLADGTYVVFWPAASGGLTAQRYAANGKAIGDVLTLASGSQGLPVALQGGGFAVAWSAPGAGGDLDVYTQLFLDVVANASFESGMTHWVDWGNTSVVAGQASSGTSALRVGPAAGGAGQLVGGIVPGNTYRLTAQARVSSASETVYVGVDFVDNQGIPFTQNSVLVTSTTYTTASLDVVAPTNAVSALVYVWKNAGSGVADVDDFALQSTGPSTARLPCSADMVSNGGFETALAGWVDWGNSSTSPAAGASGSVAQVGPGAGGFGQDVRGIVAGNTYRVSALAKVSTAAGTGYLGVKFTDDAGNGLQAQNAVFRSTAYSTVQADVTAPAGATRALVFVWKNAGGGSVDVDDVALVQVAPAVASPAPRFVSFAFTARHGQKLSSRQR